ncbi:MAG: ABC transporter ATP-binding protein [Polyangiaceae bacterium]|nr:ABC transporter ATP-binding protein [Polyangiaceae bacterium]
MALLAVSDLVTSFQTESGTVRAVDQVSFELDEGQTLGLVGESGCGKSVTALSILRLIPSPPGRYEQGKVIFRDRDLFTLPEREMRKVRGDDISMIFQEPMTSLNPVYTVGAQIVEAIRLHRDTTKQDARERAIDLLRKVGIPSPSSNVDSYPHQLSGGMRQRVMIAMALACEPQLLIADEPTTALDVTIQAQILDLIARLQRELGMAVLLITHDLSVVAEYTHKVAVMYAGQIVEYATVGELFRQPMHPYTRGLMASLPARAKRAAPGEKRPRLPVIEGMVPDLRHLPSGCRFHDRCTFAIEACAVAVPPLETKEGGHLVRCIRADEVGALPLDGGEAA